MASRFGDANEDGHDRDVYQSKDDQQQAKRRSTKYSSANIPHHCNVFKAFTKDSLLEKRKCQRVKKHSAPRVESTRLSSEPEPYLASGQQLPPALARQLPNDLVGKPIEDIDPFYNDKEVSCSSLQAIIL